MGFVIVLTGHSQCNTFAEICLVVDYLAHHLPNFCYERIEKPVHEWKAWLSKLNKKNKWHHIDSPLIWKELLIQGSKPFYIGGASEFLNYCHSYYKIELFLDIKHCDDLKRNFSQYNVKLKNEIVNVKEKHQVEDVLEQTSKKNYIITICGGSSPLTMHLLSDLMDIGNEKISKIYIHDDNCSEKFEKQIELECSFVRSSAKVVKCVKKLGIALTHTDLLVVLNHIPFDDADSVGDWLNMNREIITKLALLINASARKNIRILFPNLGPACYNATILMNALTITHPNNIVVATSDLGLDIAVIAAEIAKIPMRNMFCPPVWGFVGINHLVDINTTIHKYNVFNPYKRCIKVENSSLTLGNITPEMRTLEYLIHFDEILWTKVTEMKNKTATEKLFLNKTVAVLNVIRLWLFDTNPMNVVNLGVKCDGSFGLNFNGIFSQPCRIVNDVWQPAGDYLLPTDPQIKLPYLEEMSNFTMTLNKGDLPKIIPKYYCTCKQQYQKLTSKTF
ncbi:hypothetical protein ACJJTC_003435 [Scirpophaga incertulas]